MCLITYQDHLHLDMGQITFLLDSRHRDVDRGRVSDVDQCLALSSEVEKFMHHRSATAIFPARNSADLALPTKIHHNR